MSTKTTFKRIALVAVAALGLGVLTSVAPASAAADTGTSSFTLNASSFTVVGSGSGDYAVLEIDTIGNVNGLDSAMVDGESIKMTVTSWPTAVDSTTAAADLVLTEVATVTRSSGAKGANATSAVIGATATDGTIQFDNENVDGTVLDGGTVVAAVASGYAGSAAAKGRYFVAISKASGKALDKGEYTVRLDLLKSGNVISRSSVKVRFVTNKVDAAAKLAVSAAGVQTSGAAVVQSADNALTVALTDANGGLVREGNNAQPAVAASIADPTTATTTAALSLVDTAASADNEDVAGDGVYSTTSTLTSITKGKATVTARYGDASATGSVTVIAAATATLAASTFTVSAPGASATNTATPFLVPLTTTEASVTLTANSAGPVAVANHALVATVTWSGNFAAGDVTPKSATPAVVYTDAAGKITVTVTNKNPSNGAVATINISGCTLVSASTNCMVDQDIKFVRSFTTTVSTTSSQAVKLGATTVVTATVTDQFGKPVAGEVLQPVITGANANTTALATVTTDAAGSASISVTDAKGVEASTTLGSDTVKFTATTFAADGTTRASGSTKLTYVAAVPVITAMTAWYSLDESPAVDTYLPVPATGITNAGTYLTVPVTRDNSKLIASTGSDAADDLVAFQIRTGQKLVPVVITATKGAFIRGSIGQQLTTRTLITDADGYATFIGGSTTAGANTFTATAGTVTVSASMWLKNAASAADARFVTLTGPTTGTANGDAISFVATATDRYGNPISGVTLSVSATGAGSLAGGATLASFVTDSTGSFTFQGSSKVAAGGSATYKVVASSPAADFSSVAGKVGTTTVESTLAAGNSSASVTVAYAAGEDAAAANAQAATDAAAEATDAANAATDAANAAAEAADAATAAAQDAADAVAALSTQVSEMVNALKKQITAITNLVIKIQKKVKA
jgi:trimeric autotransporter adhesin